MREGCAIGATTGLAEWLAHLAEESPVVMLVEDLHWADDSSLAWIDAADHLLHNRPVLVIATARPALLERHPHWGEGLDFHDRLEVRSLSRRESRLLVDEILQKVDELPPPSASSSSPPPTAIPSTSRSW